MRRVLRTYRRSQYELPYGHLKRSRSTPTTVATITTAIEFQRIIFCICAASKDGINEMIGNIRSRERVTIATILMLLLTVSVTACQTEPSKSVSAKQTPTLTPTPTTTLTPCPVIENGTVKPVTAEVLAVVTQYYAAKHLTPITIYKNEETVLDVKEQSAGVHSCQNPGDGIGQYAGAVPLTATAAVMVYVKHQPYPEMPISSNFITLAQLPDKGWVVVDESTGP